MGSMGIPVFFCMFLVFCLWLRYELNKNSKTEQPDNKSFWERERESNFIPKKDITHLDYIQIPEETFPYCDNTEDAKLLELQEKVREFADKKMLNLTGYTNTDLKFAYGSGNYPLLAEYDQNFTVFIRNVYSWASYLHKIGKTDEAVILLEFCVSCRTDIAGNYTLLGTIYLQRDDLESFQKLLLQAEEIPGSRKAAIKEKLGTLLKHYT